MPMRYRLRPNKSCQVPTQHIVFDTETNWSYTNEAKTAKRHSLRLGTAIAWRWEDGVATRYKRILFTEPAELFSWIICRLHRKRGTWIWCHNAIFDWTIIRLWDYLEREEFRPASVCLEASPTFLCTRGPRGPATWIDSMNWWRCSLAELGESVGVPKLPMPEHAAPDSVWAEYCWRDTEILYSAVTSLLRFVTDNDLGCLRISASSQAMQAYRHRFAPTYSYERRKPTPSDPNASETVTECWPQIHRSQDTLDLERRAYTMGAIRLSEKGAVDGPIYCLDINSAYPAVMHDCHYPARLKAVGIGTVEREYWDTKALAKTIADCRIHCLDAIYPLRVHGNIVFPVGTFWTTLAGPELAYAAEHGHLLQIGHYAEYDMMDLFSSYVEAIYALRQDYIRLEKRAWANICKLVLNSLAGKFGQWGHAWQARNDLDPPSSWGRWCLRDTRSKVLRHFRVVAGFVEEENLRRVRTGVDNSGNPIRDAGGPMIREEHKNSFPAICAFVNSYARLRIWRALEVARESGAVFYSAVDSIHCDRSAYEALVRANLVSDTMGSFRLVSVAESAEYRGLANYSLGSDNHIAGVSPRARQLDRDTMGQETFSSSSDLLSGQKPRSMVSWESRRSIRPTYRHGVCNDDGTTRPWILPLEREEMVQCLTK